MPEDHESDEPPPPQGVQIMMDGAMAGGVYANFARVAHSPYEFTIDFARLDFSDSPPTGIVVARVSLSPLMVDQLITALQGNWSKYAAKAMPQEVYGDVARHQDDPDPPAGPGEA